jgi:hypothetical protein
MEARSFFILAEASRCDRRSAKRCPTNFRSEKCLRMRRGQVVYSVIFVVGFIFTVTSVVLKIYDFQVRLFYVGTHPSKFF